MRSPRKGEGIRRREQGTEPGTGQSLHTGQGTKKEPIKETEEHLGREKESQERFQEKSAAMPNAHRPSITESGSLAQYGDRW